MKININKEVYIIEMLNLILIIIPSIFISIASCVVASNSNKIAEKEFMPNIAVNSKYEYNEETKSYDTEKLYIQNYGYKIMDYKFDNLLICKIDIVYNNRVYSKKLNFNEYYIGNVYMDDIENLGFSYSPLNNISYYKYIKKIEELLKSKIADILTIDFSRTNYTKIEYKDSFGNRSSKFYKGDSINIKEISIKEWEEETSVESEYTIYSEKDIEIIVEKIISQLMK